MILSHSANDTKFQSSTGGVRTHASTSVRPHARLLIHSATASVYIELQTSNRNKLTIGTVYRPPKQQAADDAALSEEIQAMTQNKQSVIIGDFNCPKINWCTMNGDQECNRLFEMLEDTFMTQISLNRSERTTSLTSSS